MREHRIFYQRNLPHYQPVGATLFVTLRLHGSLPKQVIIRLTHEAELVKKLLDKIDDPVERAQTTDLELRRLFGRWDHALDHSTDGPKWLQQPEIARIMTESIHYRDGKVYELLAYTIMPNHGHLVFTPLCRDSGEVIPISDIMQSLKRHTARQANLVLRREGPLWQAESYDHVVRDGAELERVIQYVLNNPIKAGLVKQWQDWPWSWRKAD